MLMITIHLGNVDNCEIESHRYHSYIKAKQAIDSNILEIQDQLIICIKSSNPERENLFNELLESIKDLNQDFFTDNEAENTEPYE